MSSITNVLKSLGPIDARNIRRDSLLRWMAFMPFFFAFFFRLLVPWIRVRILEQFGFDLEPYYFLLMSYGFMLGTPVLFGVVIGFLLLDERDDGTLTALQITPIRTNDYLLYRVSMPIILSAILTVVAFPMAGLAQLPLGSLVMVAVAAAPLAPMFALILMLLAQNKVQGFAVMKGLGGILFLPLLAYFLQPPWQFIAGIIPTYWPLKLYWVLDAGEPGAWIFFAVSWVYGALCLVVLMRLFNRKLYR